MPTETKRCPDCAAPMDYKCSSTFGTQYHCAACDRRWTRNRAYNNMIKQSKREVITEPDPPKISWIH